ncbi:MAG TPA: rhodanese-like domain-containing protein [Acidimicrobiia bacterium]
MGCPLDDLLAAARARLDHRPGPEETAAALAAGALVVDIRPAEQRRRDGELPGAVVVVRNVLEWRLAPTSAHRLPEAGDAGRVVVVVCNEGYASSLAAATLRDVGLRRATDLDGGFQAWLRAGLPVAPAGAAGPFRG